MKYLLAVLIFIGCKNSSVTNEYTKDTVYIINSVIKKDTVFMPSPLPVIDTLEEYGTIKKLKDSLNARTKRLNIANYKLAKVDYYVKIVDSKPKQITFLKGWIKRSLRD